MKKSEIQTCQPRFQLTRIIRDVYDRGLFRRLLRMKPEDHQREDEWRLHSEEAKDEEHNVGPNLDLVVGSLV